METVALNPLVQGVTHTHTPHPMEEARDSSGLHFLLDLITSEARGGKEAMLLLVVMPGAPSSVLAPSSNARSP